MTYVLSMLTTHRASAPRCRKSSMPMPWSARQNTRAALHVGDTVGPDVAPVSFDPLDRKGRSMALRFH